MCSFSFLLFITIIRTSNFEKNNLTKKVDKKRVFFAPFTTASLVSCRLGQGRREEEVKDLEEEGCS